MAQTAQLSIFVEEQLNLSGLFQRSTSPDPYHQMTNHLADLQLSYGLSESETHAVFLTSIYLVALQNGLLDVAVLVTPPLSLMGETFCTESDQ